MQRFKSMYGNKFSIYVDRELTILQHIDTKQATQSGNPNINIKISDKVCLKWEHSRAAQYIVSACEHV